MAVHPVFARRSLLGGLAPAAAGLAGLLRPARAAPSGGGAAVAMFVAFDVLADGRPELRRLLHLLADRTAVAADTTLAVGATLFDRRFGLEPLRPRHLAGPAMGDPVGAAPGPWHGDLLLLIEAGSQVAVVSALHDLVRDTHDLLAPRWKLNGFQSPGAGAGAGAGAPVPLPPGEPEWAQGGSYVEVRKLRRLGQDGELDARPADALRQFAYDHGIDDAAQFDTGRISCRALDDPGAWHGLAAGSDRERCCGGGLFFALPDARQTAAALGDAVTAQRRLGSG
nr:Dyp-type peroxidase domain-containing protein [uncultured Lichenicoccus sp.]